MRSEMNTSVDTRTSDGTARFGFWIAIVTVAVTVVTFALALTALPNDVPYPFTSPIIAEQWPMDYLWMYPAMVLMLLFVALRRRGPPVRASGPEDVQPGRTRRRDRRCHDPARRLLHPGDRDAAEPREGTTRRVGDADPVQPERSLHRPRGDRLPADEPGPPLSGPVFFQKNRLERSIRWLFTVSFALVVLSLVVVSALLGIDRGDTFEIIVISIVWLTLIAGGVLTAMVFRRAARA